MTTHADLPTDLFIDAQGRAYAHGHEVTPQEYVTEVARRLRQEPDDFDD